MLRFGAHIEDISRELKSSLDSKEVRDMSKQIQELKEYLKAVEREYQEALQTEGETSIAFRDGVIYGIKSSIKKLELMEE